MLVANAFHVATEVVLLVPLLAFVERRWSSVVTIQLPQTFVDPLHENQPHLNLVLLNGDLGPTVPEAFPLGKAAK